MPKLIFITGATSGFGLETAKRFAAEGWRVAATYHRDEMKTAIEAVNGVVAYKLDVSNETAVTDVCERVIDEAGVPDVIVNNAGYCLMGPLESSSMEQIRRQFDVNVFGLIAVTKAYLPRLRERGSGTIFNIASSSALMNYPFVSVYGASKQAVRGLSQALFIELAPFGIKVKSVFPGIHSTKIFTKLDSATGPGHEAYAPFFRNFRKIQADGMAGDPKLVADAIWGAVRKDDDRLEYAVNRDAKLLGKMRAALSDGMWKKMNVSMIENEPSAATKAMMKFQINGTKPLEFEPSPELSQG